MNDAKRRVRWSKELKAIEAKIHGKPWREVSPLVFQRIEMLRGWLDAPSA